jgi:hypothetical protein
VTIQMTHSSHVTYDAATLPPEGKASEDLDAHIASYLQAGWTMAFYSVMATPNGSRHHFIWRGPDLPGTAPGQAVTGGA